MNIEKIKNYNQKLLAVFGTVLVLFVIVGLLFAISIAVNELTLFNNYNDNEEGILSDEKIEELQKENKYQQLISYEMPRLIDTLNLIYVIPVSHKSFDNPIFVDDGVLGLMDTFGSVDKSDRRYSSDIYGYFNNILIYDLKKDSVESLFTERVNFRNIKTEYFEDDIIILFIAANKDTHKDGVINLEDLKTLYLYSMKEKGLRKIKLENADISNFYFVENSKDLLIKFGIDKNKDGIYDNRVEPSIVKKYLFETDELVNIVNDKINKELQKRLDGTNN